MDPKFESDESLASQADDATNDDATADEEGISLEELSQSYSQLLRTASRETPGTASTDDLTSPSDDASSGVQLFDPDDQEAEEADHCPVTPLSILEAILMVGRPDNGAITASEIAGLMRGVETAEVAELIEQLNQAYEQQGGALRIAQAGSGYRMQLAPDLKFITDRFYGRVREVKLSQAAVDCLALVAYQPGISREQLDEQRGQPSGGVLNQLVRRQLLEMRREGPDKKLEPHYYPTERLLQLAGLASLEDLSQVEEWE